MCPQCSNPVPGTARYCPNCGREQSGDLTTPYGWWEVTTEGDCEGRTTNRLGIFQGNLDDIAKALADKCYYALEFRKLRNFETPSQSPKRTSVEVRISGVEIHQQQAVLLDLLRDRPVTVGQGVGYQCLKIGWQS